MLIIETKSQCLSSKTTIELINELSTCHEKVSNSTRIVLESELFGSNWIESDFRKYLEI